MIILVHILIAFLISFSQLYFFCLLCYSYISLKFPINPILILRNWLFFSPKKWGAYYFCLSPTTVLPSIVWCKHETDMTQTSISLGNLPVNISTILVSPSSLSYYHLRDLHKSIIYLSCTLEQLIFFIIFCSFHFKIPFITRRASVIQ